MGSLSLVGPPDSSRPAGRGDRSKDDRRDDRRDRRDRRCSAGQAFQIEAISMQS